MTDLNRSELFSVLVELARRYPHWRVGQLVANLAGWADADLWDAEDEALLAAARGHLSQMAARGVATGHSMVSDVEQPAVVG